MDAMGRLVLARGETNAYRNAYHALPPIANWPRPGYPAAGRATGPEPPWPP
jgi:hypothetical protein